MIQSVSNAFIKISFLILLIGYLVLCGTCFHALEGSWSGIASLGNFFNLLVVLPFSIFIVTVYWFKKSTDKVYKKLWWSSLLFFVLYSVLIAIGISFSYLK